ncbi:MAG: hypothetical protein GX267_18895 [Fibrobacter sp.]|mgnify:CR=1 FL=1|jgi:hypothetical protein|nr:hypothetical protein [Fibrobacter sp.]
MVIRYFGILLPAFILILAGCAAQNTGYGPHFSPIDKHIRKIAIFSPDLYVYDVSGGGIPEYRIDWSKSAETTLSNALKLQLEKKQIEGIDVTDIIDTSVTDTILPVIKLIISSIQKHLYGNGAFITQIDTFDYHTGPLSELCNSLQTDAVMFTFGSDENFSPLREIILKKATTAKNVKSAISGILTGTVSIYSVPLARTFACCLVADKNGKIIWYKQYIKSDGADLRKSFDAEKIAGQLLSGLHLRRN